ncbi:hypothetical protein BGZ81_001233 [Podila clonocystis]|nr:hypothetical protein BGZ81_001233 [Podila clonocystis]
MHSLNNCPLRTFASITTTSTFPFYILTLDDAALDLFLTGPNSPTAEQRTAACLALKGKTIAQVLLNDTDSCLKDTNSNNNFVIQPYVLAKDLLCEGPLSIKKRTRRVHACIHAISHASSSSLSPSSTTESSSTSIPLSSDQDSRHSTESRLYVLKDVTEIQGLAQAAQADIRMRLAAQQRLVYQDQDQDQDQKSEGSISSSTLLLLQVTRFGTIDHAFTIPQIPSSAIAHVLDTCQPSESIHALSNTSAMSYAHPDDLRLFCQGLDRTCKSLYHVFRVRWRKSGLGPVLKGLKDEDEENVDVDEDEDKDNSNMGGLALGGSSRTIEFQGELFEEWVDSTAMSLVTSESSPRDADNYLWTEITGVLSNTQPLLVVRPLTLAEVHEQEKLQGQLKMIHISNQQARVEKKREMLHRQWKNKSKNMGLEEARVPKKSSLFALTSLSKASSSSSTLSLSSFSSTCSSMSSISSTSDMEIARSGSHFRMPGSLPPTTRCRASATANELMGMPSVLAFPTASAPWSVLTGIAVDAWNQWIMVVHAGQAQFQDWCIYILELTVEQLIESLSLGMTLIGGRTYRHQQEPLTEYEHEQLSSHRQSSSLPERLQVQEVREEPHLSGLQRAGKVLEEYPSVSGVVHIFGNSWLGQKLRGKLEHKLNKVANQVVDWWEKKPSLPCSSDASSASSDLNMTSGSAMEPLSSCQ